MLLRNENYNYFVSGKRTETGRIISTCIPRRLLYKPFSKTLIKKSSITEVAPTKIIASVEEWYTDTMVVLANVQDLIA